MTSLLFGIILSALLSTASLLVILLRSSPISTPLYALPAFFIAVFLSVSSVSSLLLYVVWRLLPIHTWDMGKVLAISVREGVFVGACVLLFAIFLALGFLTWWIAGLIVLFFGLLELALQT